jgi:hypothetical protein
LRNSNDVTLWPERIDKTAEEVKHELPKNGMTRNVDVEIIDPENTDDLTNLGIPRRHN